MAEAPSIADAQIAHARAIVDALRAGGVRDVVSSPGSRSTPLVLAALDAGMRFTEVLDERAAAFVALGQARVTGVPSVLFCTSGSAGAHYLPAFIEGREARIPIIAVTANRPTDLQDIGAPQTTRQADLLSSHAVFRADLGGLAPAGGGTRRVATKVARAVATAIAERAPVHLDAPFYKPLQPSEWPLGAATPETRPAGIAPQRHPSREAIARLSEIVRSAVSGVVVLGPGGLESIAHTDAVQRFCARSGFALLAESTSQLRDGSTTTVGGAAFHRADAFDLVLRAPDARAALEAECVVQIGTAPVSKSFGEWVGAAPRRHVVIHPFDWHDPSATAELVVAADPAITLAALTETLPEHAPDSVVAASHAWVKADAAAWDGVLAAILDDGDALTNASLVRTLATSLPDGGLFFVGNGLSVRDLDWFAPALPESVGVLSQRGCSGIDGCVAATLGTASRNTGRPTTALLGDLSFLHDVGALQLAHLAAGAPCVIVVANNRGGRIFEQLPVARLDPTGALTDRFTTPHAMDLGAISAGFGVRTRTVDRASDLARALVDGWASDGLTVVEARLTESDVHSRVFGAAAKRVASAFEVPPSAPRTDP